MSSISTASTYQGIDLAGHPSRRRRAGALLIDVFINFTVFSTSFILIGVHLYAAHYLITGRDLDFNSFSESVVAELFFRFVLLFVAFIYFVAFEAIYGATPGKHLLGMHVFKSDGRRCDTGSAVIRAICLFMIDSLIWGLPAFASMQPPLYQRIGDRAAKTVVVNRHESPVPLPPFWRFLVAMVIYLMITNLAALIVLFTLII